MHEPNHEALIGKSGIPTMFEDAYTIEKQIK